MSTLDNNLPQGSSVGFMVTGAGPEQKVQATLLEKIAFKKQRIGLMKLKGIKYIVTNIQHEMKYLFTGRFEHPKPVESKPPSLKL